MIKGIIFDHDGTLVNTEHMHYECWCEVLEDYGVNFPFSSYVQDFNGVPTLKNAEMLIDMHKLDISAEALCETKLKLATQRFSESPCPLMPYAEKTVHDSYKAGYTLAIATGAGKKEIAQTLTAYPLEHFFSAIATRDDVASAKPAPDVYLEAVKRLELSPSECVALEDTRAGIQSAKDAGLYCIAVLNEFSEGQDLSLADAKCENLSIAFEHIKQI